MITILVAGGVLAGCTGPRTQTPGATIDDVTVMTGPGIRAEDIPKHDGATNVPAPNVTVDPKLPPAPALLGARMEKRPVATVSQNGTTARFVENELILLEEPTRAETIRRALNAKVLASVNLSALRDPAAHGAPVLGARAIYHLKVEPAKADPVHVAEQILKLSSHPRNLSVSSEAGLSTLALASDLAIGGANVALNWVFEPHSIADGNITEAPTGDNGFPVNASEFFYMNRSQPQDIGVVAAWQTLQDAGRLARGVGVGVIDAGFVSDPDLPPGGAATCSPTLCLGSPFNVSGRGVTSGGTPAPFHGANVLSAAMAVENNGFGSAGPAGPVAVPFVFAGDTDAATVVAASATLWAQGASILVMSFSGYIPASLAWSAEPLHAATLALRTAGVLITASAGNHNVDIDEEDCVPYVGCSEKNLTVPCELAGVLCVGAIGRNAMLASFSNFGSRGGVPMFAPGIVWVGPDGNDAQGANIAKTVQGTSFSAPFVAGVAALVKTANPSLTPAQLEGILISTAHPSPDSSVGRFVDAHRAVASTLSGAEMQVTILSPMNGDVFSRGEDVHFVGAWNLPGPLESTTWSEGSQILSQNQTFTRADLPYGQRTITFHGFSDLPTEDSAQVQLTIRNDPPIVHLDAPLRGDLVYEGQLIALQARSFDRNAVSDSLRRLPDSAIEWTLDGTTLLGRGHVLRARLSEGTHVLRVTATDDGGLNAWRETVVTVLPAVDDLPRLDIQAPLPEAIFEARQGNPSAPFAQVKLLALLRNDTGATPPGWVVTWTDARSPWPFSDSSTILGTGLDSTVQLPSLFCVSMQHRITATAVGPSGLKVAQTHVVHVENPSC